MRKFPLFPVFVLAALCSLPVAVPGSAQDTNNTSKPANDDHHKDTLAPLVSDRRYFRLDFVIREVGEDGKAINSRAYSVILSSNDEHDYAPNTSIRTGSKIPVYTNGSKTFSQYMDIGVNIDCRNVHLNQNNSLTLVLEAEVSSIVDGPGADLTPVVRQNKWNSQVVLPLNKPTILFSSDNVSSKGKLQLELTATPIK